MNFSCLVQRKHFRKVIYLPSRVVEGHFLNSVVENSAFFVDVEKLGDVDPVLRVLLGINLNVLFLLVLVVEGLFGDMKVTVQNFDINRFCFLSNCSERRSDLKNKDSHAFKNFGHFDLNGT
jgi:hypothetical protein